MCELLKIKENPPYTFPTPVEAALEANEAAISSNRKKVDAKMKSNMRIHAKLNNQESGNETPKLVRVPPGSLPPLQISPSKQIKSNDNEKNKKIEVVVHRDNVENVGKADALLKSNLTKVRYEIPENSLSRTATLILSNRKELEMREFSSSLRLGDKNIVSGDNRQRIPSMPEIDPSGDRQTLE